MENTKNKQTVKELIEKEKCELVDVKFSDLHGLWQHFTVPCDTLGFNSNDDLPFDGSSIRGFQEINESDMSLKPDYSSVFVDPFSSKSISVICDVYDPIKKEYYSRDPRVIAKKAEAFLKETGIGDTAYMGPEAEFFIFDEIRYDQNEYSGYYYIDSSEGIWNSGKAGNNLAYKPRHKEGYFPVAPHDSLHEIRNDMILTMMRCGLKIEKHHHEVATAGQCEIGVRYDSLVRSADNLQTYKYVVKNIARKHGKVATFMPKPLFNDNGSGMHTNISINKNGINLFYDNKGKAKLSPIAWKFVDRILSYATDVSLILNASVNAYRRLDPHFEAPNEIKVSEIDRGAMIRIPIHTEKSARIEVRSIGPEYKKRYMQLKMIAADRSPLALGTKVKKGEVIYHHEIYNQLLWNEF